MLSIVDKPKSAMMIFDSSEDAGTAKRSISNLVLFKREGMILQWSDPPPPFDDDKDLDVILFKVKIF